MERHIHLIIFLAESARQDDFKYLGHAYKKIVGSRRVLICHYSLGSSASRIGHYESCSEIKSV